MERWPDFSVVGWRARLGLIVPPTNVTNETEWHRAAPAGVSVHVTRMPLHLDVRGPVGDDDPLARDLLRAAHDLAAAGVAAIAYGCTAGSMVEPLDRLPQIVTAATGVPATTTAGAVVAALRALGARRVALAAPYHDALVAHEAAFLRAQGFEVVAARGLGIGAGGPHEFSRLRTLGPGIVTALARSVTTGDADAIFLACTDLGTLDVVDALEADLGRPVVTSNQAQLHATLRAAGVRTPVVGWGRLLASV